MQKAYINKTVFGRIPADIPVGLRKVSVTNTISNAF